MRYRWRGSFGYGCRFFPFGSFLSRPRPSPRREQYLRVLRRYKEELEAELKDVEREIAELEKQA